MSIDKINLSQIVYVLHQCDEPKKQEQYKLFLDTLIQQKPSLNNLISSLLVLLNRDLQDDAEYTTLILKILLKVLKEFDYVENTNNKKEKLEIRTLLVKSALTIIKLQMMYSVNKVTSESRNLTYQVMVAYPAEVFVDLANSHSHRVYSAISQTLRTKCGVTANDTTLFQNGELNNDALIFDMIKKILNTLPNEINKTFVTNGLDIWFSNVVPYTISLMICDLLSENSIFVEVVHLLITELADIDYKANKEWKNILERIINPSGYQTLLKNSLKSGSDNWYIIWCILIRLLKSRTVTKDSPINYLLPVVEIAFKSDSQNRCRAFTCWKTLAEHFAGDKNAEKRMTFLLIPLESNNAKVKEVIIAKFSCWWYIIKCYKTKINSSNNAILMKFLYFCFGSKSNSEYEEMRYLASQAMLDIVGHDTDCEGCTNPILPRMMSPILDAPLLTYYLRDWKHYLRCTYDVICNNINSENIQKQITCIWKSIFKIVSTRANNNVRRDLTFELLEDCLDILKKHDSANFMAIALSQIFLEENSNHSLLACTENEDINSEPLSLLFQCILYKKNTKHLPGSGEPLPKLRPLIEVGYKSYNDVKYFDWLLSHLTEHDFHFWIAACEFVISQKTPVQSCYDMLKWPMVKNAHIEDIDLAITTWDKMYKYLRSIVHKEVKDSDLSQLLISYKRSKLFSVFGLLIICTHSWSEELFESIINILNRGSVRNDWAVKYLPNMENFFNDVTKELCNVINVDRAENVIKTLHGFLKYLMKAPVVKLEVKVKKLLLLERFLINANIIFGVKNYKNLRSLIKNTATTISKCNNLNNINKNTKPLPDTSDVVDMYENNDKNEESSEIVHDIAKLRPAEGNLLNHKSNDTIKLVVENGENVIIVDSNKKFNPLKLTEHQKERLQRKRDDIPALYQDLSQSQDEFKKKYWTSLDKPEAKKVNQEVRDGSSVENSKTINNCKIEDVTCKKSTIITIPSPYSLKRLKIQDRINQNINLLKANSEMITQSESLEIRTPNKVKEIETKTDNQITKRSEINVNENNTANQTNSPNIINKIGKTSIPKNKKEINLIDIKNNKNDKNYTPKKKNTNVIPVSTERPLRVKRKPRKFAIEIEDVNKKRRVSLPNLSDLNTTVTHGDLQNNKVVSRNLENINDNCLDANLIDVTEKHLTGYDVLDVANTTNQDDDITQIEYNEELTDNNSLISVKNNQTVEGIKTVKHTQSTNTTIKQQNVDDAQNMDDVQMINDMKTVDGTQTVDDTQNGITSQTVDDTQNIEAKQSLDDTQNVEATQTVDDAQTVGDTQTLDNTQTVVDTHTVFDAQIIDDTQIVESTHTFDVTHTIGDNQPSISSNSTDKDKSEVKSSSKAGKGKQSRLVKNLAIDMIEGNPFLEKPSPRRTRRSPDQTEPKKCTKRTNNAKTKTKDKENINSKKIKNCIKKVTESELNNSISVDIGITDLNESPLSEDFIESSQDSTISTISVKSRRSLRRQSCTETPTITSKSISIDNTTIQTKELTDSTFTELTATMNTEPLINTPLTNENSIPGTEINSQDKTTVGPETQELAEADTQPVDPSLHCIDIDSDTENHMDTTITVNEDEPKTSDITDILTGCVSSPFKDDEQRNEVFLNNTLDISPIKSMVPKKENNTPNISDEYIVIKLTSPVQSNGEPMKDESPEMFTNDKLSPSNNELSPPREVSIDAAASPLSLKKNRIQMTGRAAQMLSLCQPDKLHSMMINDKGNESEEPKKNCVGISARRNLQLMYNMNVDANDKSEDKLENFLKLERPLPSANSSPIGPILKRKLVDIEDEITMSPASKKKRVSFHDPPVSTTVVVQKYIDTSERSPQNSHLKRNERPHRKNMKPPKQLDALFQQTLTPTKCNDIVIKDIEDSNIIDSTPLIEVVNVSELNDTEPISAALINCMDPIEVIATDLSSPAMKDLFVKELHGKINTVSDFAKLSELEVNRLCIKAPKVEVAKDVLANYLAKIEAKLNQELDDKNDTSSFELHPKTLYVDMEVQTVASASIDVSVQTNREVCSDVLVQTMESSFVSTDDLITSCIKERPDFIENIVERKELQNSLSLNTLLPAMKTNITSDAERKMALDGIISKENDLNILNEYLCDKFNSKSLVMFCSDLLKRVHQKMDK